MFHRLHWSPRLHHNRNGLHHFLAFLKVNNPSENLLTSWTLSGDLNQQGKTGMDDTGQVCYLEHFFLFIFPDWNGAASPPGGIRVNERRSRVTVLPVGDYKNLSARQAKRAGDYHGFNRLLTTFCCAESRPPSAVYIGTFHFCLCCCVGTVLLCKYLHMNRFASIKLLRSHWDLAGWSTGVFVGTLEITF